MKVLLAAIVLFSSNFAFAISDEEAIASLLMSCSIEKFCQPGTTTSTDDMFLNNKAVSETQLGMSCNEVDLLYMIPGVKDTVKQLAGTVSSTGIVTSCLANITF
jgi:hypothetical protein